MKRLVVALLASAMGVGWPTLGFGQVTVSGSGAVGVGTMSGGSINVGLTATEAKALATATGQHLLKQLEAIAVRINAQQGAKANAQAVSLGVVQGFLATVKGKQVPPEEWPQTFGELTRQYLVLGERIQATPVTNDQIKELVAKAEEARMLGLLAQADQYLAMAEELATDDALTKQDQAKASTRQAASLMASRAAIAFARLEWVQGATLLEKAFELRRLDPSSEALWWMFEAGGAWVTHGKTDEALKRFATAGALALMQAALEPGNAQWQRDLSVSHFKTGDVQRTQGDLSGALKSYQAGMGIAQRLASADPSNSQKQRDLLFSDERIGDVQQAQGDLGGALKSYQASMEIAQRLASADPSNTQRQRDLSVVHSKIGYVQKAQVDLGGALKSYQASMGIAQMLASADPSNTQWQRDLSVSHNKIGDVRMAQGDLGGALKSYQASMGIRQNLASVDPSNTQWQKDLSVSHNKIGEVQQAQGDVGGALKSYQAGMGIAEKLASADPGNADWQLDLVTSCWNIYEASAVAAVDERRRVLNQGMAVLTTLQAADKLHPRAKTWPLLFAEALQGLR